MVKGKKKKKRKAFLRDIAANVTLPYFNKQMFIVESHGNRFYKKKKRKTCFQIIYTHTLSLKEKKKKSKRVKV